MPFIILFRVHKRMADDKSRCSIALQEFGNKICSIAFSWTGIFSKGEGPPSPQLGSALRGFVKKKKCRSTQGCILCVFFFIGLLIKSGELERTGQCQKIVVGSSVTMVTVARVSLLRYTPAHALTYIGVRRACN